MGDCLTINQWMANDAPLISADGRYAAYLQSDANLVLCHTRNGAADLSRPYWSVFAKAGTHVHGSRVGPPYYARMQSDGNFVLYNGRDPNSAGPPYWATDTNRSTQGQFTAVIQNDGNFVVYEGTPGAYGAPIWASGTWPVSLQVTGGDRLNTSQWMANDSALVSADGRFAAYLQDDANLILCHTTNGAPDLSRPYWSVFANAAGQTRGQRVGPPYYVQMQGDGNLVLYNGTDPANAGPPYWATNTNRSQGQFIAIIQTDGNFVIYELRGSVLITGDPKGGTSSAAGWPDRTAIWASNTANWPPPQDQDPSWWS